MREDGAICLGRALGVASGEGWENMRVGAEAFRAVMREVGQDNIIAWNDAPGRIKEEVVSALRNSKRWL